MRFNRRLWDVVGIGQRCRRLGRRIIFGRIGLGGNFLIQFLAPRAAVRNRQPTTFMPPANGGGNRVTVDVERIGDVLQQLVLPIQGHYIVGDRLVQRRVDVLLLERRATPTTVGHL